VHVARGSTPPLPACPPATTLDAVASAGGGVVVLRCGEDDVAACFGGADMDIDSAVVLRHSAKSGLKGSGWRGGVKKPGFTPCKDAGDREDSARPSKVDNAAAISSISTNELEVAVVMQRSAPPPVIPS
jgi:hypothetical protein